MYFLVLVGASIVGTRRKRLNEAVLAGVHGLCFGGRNKKIIYTPVNPNFTI